MRQSAVEVISKIARYGNHSHIEAIIDANIIPILVRKLRKGQNDYAMYAVCAIKYLVERASPEQTCRLLECNVLEPMCNLLSRRFSPFYDILTDLIVTLKNILKVRFLFS